ncbi:MAG: DNRLRE domain-containing protein [Chlorobi bacterium]|nr:DNRLRE domain-containing protein [Chlorobiota bacterium]
MKKVSILLTIFIAFAISFWGCENNKMPVENENNFSNSELNKMHNKVQSVVLYLDAISVNKGSSNDPINIEVYKLKENWDETFVTWLKRTSSETWYKPGGWYFEPNDPSFIPKATINSTGPVEVNITSLWSDGAPLNGIIIKVDKPFGESMRYVVFASRENTGRTAPQVKITYKDASTKTLPVIADSYIWDGDESPNGANVSTNDRYPYLYAGIYSSREKRSVLAFSYGCTYTQGYWKTHAKGRKYDNTWDLLSDGPNTKFFNSAKSYIKVLWTHPRRGNAYYILAHQYIAAELNQLNSASIPTEVKTAFDRAKELFSASASDTIGNTDRQEWIDLTQILDDYNNGLLGPGHCDDCKGHKKNKKEYKKDKKYKKWRHKP